MSGVDYHTQFMEAGMKYFVALLKLGMFLGWLIYRRLFPELTAEQLAFLDKAYDEQEAEDRRRAYQRYLRKRKADQK